MIRRRVVEQIEQVLNLDEQALDARIAKNVRRALRAGGNSARISRNSRGVTGVDAISGDGIRVPTLSLEDRPPSDRR